MNRWKKLAWWPLIFCVPALAADPLLESRLQAIERTLGSGVLYQSMQRLDLLEQSYRERLGAEQDMQYQVGEAARQIQALQQQVQALQQQVQQLELKQQQQQAASVAAKPELPVLKPAPEAGEAGTTGTTGTTPTAPAVSTGLAGGSAEDEQNRYTGAFENMKRGKYADATQAFERLLQDYPSGDFSSRAVYWLGEAYYVQGEFTAALSNFDRLIEGYPNSAKRADALLKKAYCLRELGQKDQAVEVLQMLVDKHPDSAAARLAKRDLN